MDAGSDSPPLRTTILGSLLRGRPRNASQSHTNTNTTTTTTTNDHNPSRDLSPSPLPASPTSPGTFSAVAALTGGTGSLITNATNSTLSGTSGLGSTTRHLPRQSNVNPASQNANPTVITLSTSPPASSGNIAPSPSSPSLPSAPSAFASMLRRKPNPNNHNTNSNQQGANAASSTSPVILSSSVPNQIHTPQLPTSQPSGISAAAGANANANAGSTPSSMPSAPSMPSMPGGLPMMSSSTSTNVILPPNTNTTAHQPNAFRIRLVPHLDSRRSLRFEAITRDLCESDPALRIGRFTDRSGMGLSAVNALGSNKLAFKSKVVSRAHAEIWAEKGGKFFIRDTKSSSGTFLNHIRLSLANQESRPFQLKDGDILQLGVDYQGGAEDIYKSVKIRVEVGREWQAGANVFNTAALKNLKNLAAIVGPTTPAAASTPGKSSATKSGKVQIPDCCICLFGVTIRQALFIAPCSHTFHFKCIRPLLEAHHPAFSCPLCRTYADLDEDVEVEGPEVDIDAEEADAETGSSNAGGSGADGDNAGGNGNGSFRTQPQQQQQQQRDDAEMSDASSALPPRAPSTPSGVQNSNANANANTTITGTPNRLLPITEYSLDRDREREAGVETEVEADTIPHTSLLGTRRVRGRNGTGVGGRGARYVGGTACTDDDGDGIPIVVARLGMGLDEADEVEMGDAVGYNGPEEDSAMDEEHDYINVDMAVVVPVEGAAGGAVTELGVGVGSEGVGGATVSGGHGSVGGKRKR
ncbi:hypothetical protein AX15_005152 [Amanita polypyramis BW_CC]|nr:hypothetical protein AX15_005152 [Amanita polypyramis BW_CC]